MVKHSLSIVIPIYNEASGIQNFLDLELAPVLKDLGDFKISLILVNDGSTDETLPAIKSSQAIKLYPTKIISFTRNFGKEIALAAGLQYSVADATIIIDSDGQHPASAIPKMLESWQAGAKIVTAVDKHNATNHRLGSKLYYLIMRAMKSGQVIEGAMDFRLLDAAVVKEYNKFTEHNRLTRGLIDWLGFPQTYLAVNTKKRLSGTPTYSFKKLMALAGDSFVSMSRTPLVIFGYLGLLITATSLPLGLFVLIEQYLLGDPLGLDWSGAVAMCIFIAFLVGLVLIFQSITSLYISHIHAEAKNRPLFVIDHDKSLNLEER